MIFHSKSHGKPLWSKMNLEASAQQGRLLPQPPAPISERWFKFRLLCFHSRYSGKCPRHVSSCHLCKRHRGTSSTLAKKINTSKDKRNLNWCFSREQNPGAMKEVQRWVHRDHDKIKEIIGCSVVQPSGMSVEDSDRVQAACTQESSQAAKAPLESWDVEKIRISSLYLIGICCALKSG